MLVTFTVAARPVGDRGTPVGNLDRVVAAGAVDDHLIVLAVPGVAAEGGGQVGVDGLHVGAGEVVDRHCVEPPSALKSTVSTVRIHRDRALGAEEAQTLTVRRQVDLLAAVGSVEQHRVGAVLALDGVAAVARIPDERVVARAEVADVVAPVPVDRVVAVAAEGGLDTLGAGDRVVPRATVERQGDRLGGELGRRDRVVAPRALTSSLSLGSWC